MARKNEQSNIDFMGVRKRGEQCKSLYSKLPQLWKICVEVIHMCMLDGERDYTPLRPGNNTNNSMINVI